MLFFLTFYVFKRVLATYIERKRLDVLVSVIDSTTRTHGINAIVSVLAPLVSEIENVATFIFRIC